MSVAERVMLVGAGWAAGTAITWALVHGDQPVVTVLYAAMTVIFLVAARSISRLGRDA